ncbi:MAG: arginine--tRNA ligase [Clostridia bacterium]|nr:arginine--tRNA ligase [Clostridia bacterium]
MNFKQLMAQNIKLNGVETDFAELITETTNKAMGDYQLASFSLAKILKKSPIDIAKDIQANYPKTEFIDKVEAVNGYVNFFLNKEFCAKQILAEIDKDECFAKPKENSKKTACLEFSSVNLAKYMHIGHLSTTMIGESLSRIYEELGYNVVRINYVGDYGTPFGKMTYAHTHWGSDAELNKRGIDYLQDLYIEFCKRAETQPELEDYAREYFKKISDKDDVVYPLFLKFIEVSKIEVNRILTLLDVHFDSWKGESAYSEEMNNVMAMLEAKNLLIDSRGAKIVDLEPYNLGTCLIQKSDGTSLYATRDISAAIDRYNTYHFDEMIYVTAVQQKLHFAQFFKVLELLGYDFSKNLKHVYYGMFSLPTGKIASRKGKQAILVDLMDNAYNKVMQVIKDRNFDDDKKKEIAQKISLSALKFTPLKNERIKDTVFDIDTAFNFDGDTSAYLQYTYARICSVLRKANIIPNDVDFSKLQSDSIAQLVLLLNRYNTTLQKAKEQLEPSILCKYTLDVCKLFNKFYNQERVLTDDKNETNAKIYLLTNIKKVLQHLFHLICIDTIEEM